MLDYSNESLYNIFVYSYNDEPWVDIDLPVKVLSLSNQPPT